MRMTPRRDAIEILLVFESDAVGLFFKGGLHGSDFNSVKYIGSTSSGGEASNIHER